MKLLRSKRIQLVITLLLCLAIIASGSFAWFSVTQNVLNEFSWNPEGVNLHDDFLDPNKDVYVENTSQDPVLVRVKLAEFMQYETKLATVVLPADAVRENRATWGRHDGAAANQTATDCSGGLHTYWSWSMGGQKWYVPATTDQAALEGNDAVVRGLPLTQAETAALEARIAADLDKDGQPHQPSTQSLLDEVSATKAQLMTLIEAYTADDTAAQEALAAARSALNAAQSALNTAAKQRFGVLQTRAAQVITMAEWIAGDQKLGDFWVVDSNGWCYWANVLEAGEATGLLVNSVDGTEELAKLKTARQPYYYGIDVSMQAATAEDVAHYWTISPELPSAADLATTEAQTLLNRLAAVSKTGAAATVTQTNTLQAALPERGKHWQLADGVWTFNDGHWSYDGETWLLEGEAYPFAEENWTLLDDGAWTYADDNWYFNGDTWLELATLPSASPTPTPSLSPSPTPMPSTSPTPSPSATPTAEPTPESTAEATQSPPATETPQASAAPPTEPPTETPTVPPASATSAPDTTPNGTENEVLMPTQP